MSEVELLVGGFTSRKERDFFHRKFPCCLILCFLVRTDYKLSHTSYQTDRDLYSIATSPNQQSRSLLTYSHISIMPFRIAFLSGLFAGVWIWLIPFAGAQPR